MKTKLIEIRDRGTRILVMAIKMVGQNNAETRFLAHTGFSPLLNSEAESTVLLIRPEDPMCRYDVYRWNIQYSTTQEAHLYIQEHFDELGENALLDLEYIRGERSTPKKSEIWEDNQYEVLHPRKLV